MGVRQLVVWLLTLRWAGFRRGVIDPLAVGYLSRLGADLLTTSGLRLAWPSRRRQEISLCRTGSLGESIIATGVALGAGAAKLRLHPVFGM